MAQKSSVAHLLKRAIKTKKNKKINDMSKETNKVVDNEQENENINTENTENAATSTDASDEAVNGQQVNEQETEPSAEDKLQEMGQKLVESNDKYVRLYSEYENYRKRTNLEKADLLINGAKDTIKAILPVVDDMERALAHMSDDDPSKEGVQLIFNKLISILSAKGLKPIEAKDQKFDENLHEAITQIPAPDEEMKGKVVDVVEKGYYLNDKVLRYAKVVVAI